jgi:hypothetical protein
VGQGFTIEREQGARLTDLGWRAGLDVQVRAVALDEHREPAVELVHDASPAVGRGEEDGAFALGIACPWAGDLVLLGLDHVMTSRG